MSAVMGKEMITLGAGFRGEEWKISRWRNDIENRETLKLGALLLDYKRVAATRNSLLFG
jgi:hypothetical protein